MNKKKIKIIAIISIIIISFLTYFIIKENNELIIQGEVDTKTVDLSSKITGRVDKIHVKKGDIVEKGQVLITLDIPDISAKYEQADASVMLAQAQSAEVNNGSRLEQKQMAYNSLKEAEAKLDIAKKTYDRVSRLNKEGVLSDQKSDEAYATYKSAQEAVAVAKSNYQMLQNGSRYEDKLSANANVKKAKSVLSEINSYVKEKQVIAPISGQITDIPVEEGELVGAGYSIISIVDTTDNWVVFNLREDLLSKIKMGSEFDVVIPAISKKPMRVKVNFISALGNFATWRATRIRGDFDLKTFEVRAVPIEPNPDLRAGMTAVVDWGKVGKDNKKQNRD